MQNQPFGGVVTIPTPPLFERVALVANVKDTYTYSADSPPDAGAEFDSRTTVEAIAAALRTIARAVTILEADRTLPEALANLQPDLVFNIAEGSGTDAREAHVPALCALLGIPYTASPILANTISLDKAHTKRIWRSFGLPTPRFQEFRTGNERISRALRYPLFVKPVSEGTGMGIDAASIVADGRALRRRVRYVIDTYRQPALVEEFMSGREFTVGYIGNRYSAEPQRRDPALYNGNGYHIFPVLEIDTSDIETNGVYGVAAKSIDVTDDSAPGYLCPADIPVALYDQLGDLAIRAGDAIGARDVARVDFRLDEAGMPHLLEINTLPGLNRTQSDLCIMAAAEGMPYETLITEIVFLAAERCGIMV